MNPSGMDARLDVLCFGEAIVDFMPEAPGLPLEEVAHFTRCLGGAPANVAVGLARLGCKSGLMTLVGADAFGRFLRKALANEGVDVTGVGIHPAARTGITFVSVGAEGQRSFTFYRHPSADMLMSAADVNAEIISASRVFHFGSSTLANEVSRAATLAALGEAKRAGVLISCDPNLRLHLWRDVEDAKRATLDVLGKCDVVKLSDDEAPFLFGDLAQSASPEAVAEKLTSLGVAIAIVTMGDRGTYVRAASGSRHLAAEKVRVVDTTGAGDGFVAGFWAALLGRLGSDRGRSALGQLDRRDIEAACRYANRVAGKTVTAFGATAALPRKEELEKWQTP